MTPLAESDTLGARFCCRRIEILIFSLCMLISSPSRSIQPLYILCSHVSRCPKQMHTLRFMHALSLLSLYHDLTVGWVREEPWRFFFSHINIIYILSSLLVESISDTIMQFKLQAVPDKCLPIFLWSHLISPGTHSQRSDSIIASAQSCNDPDGHLEGAWACKLAHMLTRNQTLSLRRKMCDFFCVCLKTHQAAAPQFKRERLFFQPCTESWPSLAFFPGWACILNNEWLMLDYNRWIITFISRVCRTFLNHPDSP